MAGVLTTEEIAGLERHGFAAIDRTVFDPGVLDADERRLDRAFASTPHLRLLRELSPPAHPDLRNPELERPSVVVAGLRRSRTLRSGRRLAGAALGLSHARLIYDHAIRKPARHGESTAWHQTGRSRSSLTKVS